MDADKKRGTKVRASSKLVLSHKDVERIMAQPIRPLVLSWLARTALNAVLTAVNRYPIPRSLYRHTGIHITREAIVAEISLTRGRPEAQGTAYISTLSIDTNVSGRLTIEAVSKTSGFSEWIGSSIEVETGRTSVELAIPSEWTTLESVALVASNLAAMLNSICSPSNLSLGEWTPYVLYSAVADTMPLDDSHSWAAHQQEASEGQKAIHPLMQSDYTDEPQPAENDEWMRNAMACLDTYPTPPQMGEEAEVLDEGGAS